MARSCNPKKLCASINQGRLLEKGESSKELSPKETVLTNGFG